jgi:purine-cytosine permease-like protein
MRPLHDDTACAEAHADGMALALHDSPVDTPVAARPRASERPRHPLGRRAHRAVLVAHVLTAVGWFGVAVTVAFCGIVGSSSADIAFYEVIGATLWLSVPLGLAAALTGVVLSLTTRWGLARHWWVVGKEAITLAVIATDVLVVAPTMERAVDTATPTGIPGPIYAHCVVLALATALSVIKPKARTPLAPRPTP